MTTPTPNPTVAPTVEQVMLLAFECETLAIPLMGYVPGADSKKHREAIAKLRSAVEALAVDAERYRWLRDKSEPGICAFYLSVGKAFHGVKFKPETVDEAIDAARTKGS